MADEHKGFPAAESEPQNRPAEKYFPAIQQIVSECGVSSDCRDGETSSARCWVRTSDPPPCPAIGDVPRSDPAALRDWLSWVIPLAACTDRLRLLVMPGRHEYGNAARRAPHPGSGRSAAAGRGAGRGGFS